MPAKKRRASLSDVNATKSAHERSVASAADLVQRSYTDASVTPSADSAQFAANERLGEYYGALQAMKKRHAQEMAAMQAPTDATAVRRPLSPVDQAIEAAGPEMDDTIERYIKRVRK